MSVYEVPAPEGYEERKKLQFEILDKINQKLEKKYQMNTSAIGSSGDGCLLKSVSISFQRFEGPMTLDENRKILLDCIGIYIDAFNNNEKIRSFLSNYPFTEKNIELIIHSYGKDGERLFDPMICCAFNYPKGISYYTNDPDKEYKYKHEIKETYQEAYSKLKETKENQHKQRDSI